MNIGGPITCECCRTRPGASRKMKGRDTRAVMCDPCASGGHMVNACLLCSQLTWDCARWDHLRLNHARLIPRIIADQGIKVAEPPKPEIIGKIHPELL